MHERHKDLKPTYTRKEKKLSYQIATLKKQLENLTELLNEYKKNKIIGPYNDQVLETIDKVKAELKEKEALAEAKGLGMTTKIKKVKEAEASTVIDSETQKPASTFKYEPVELKVRYPGETDTPISKEEIDAIRKCNCPHKCHVHLKWRPYVLWKIFGYTGALIAAGYIGKQKIDRFEEKRRAEEEKRREEEAKRLT